jgi:hypothetical protein
MKRMILFAICAALAGLIVCATVSCGVVSPCESLLRTQCDCIDGTAARNQCNLEVDTQTFSAAQDTECSKYVSTCTCDAFKAGDKAACGDLGSIGV